MASALLEPDPAGGLARGKVPAPAWLIVLVAGAIVAGAVVWLVVRVVTRLDRARRPR